MQVTINTVSEVQQEAEIELNSTELQPHFEQAYVKYRPKVELKGFRKGKVPLDMIKKLYGEAIEQDALDTIAGEFYNKAMEEKGIRPLGQPTMVDMNFKRGENFRFKIKYEVKPAIELKKYKGVKVERPVHKLTDEEVNSEIHHLQRVNSTTSPAERVTDTEYIVTADVQELDETGTPMIGKKTPATPFYLADETLAKEIKEALSNAEVGGTYRAKVQSRHDDHEHTMHFGFTVTKIEKVDLPAFNDELVKKITKEKVTSADEFRKNLRTDLQRYWDEQADAKVKDALADELVREHEFPVPDAVVAGFLDSFVEDIKNKSEGRKLPKNFDEQQFRTESRPHAIWQAKWLLLKQRIAEAENITVSDDEIEKLAEADAPKIGIDKARLLQYYKSSGSTGDRILSDKIMTFLKSAAKISDKVIEER